MKILKNTLIILTALTLISCDEEEKTDMSKLMDYYFEFSVIPEFENNHYVLNDTIIYSFESSDSVISIRLYYQESPDGINEYVKTDTTCRKYYIHGNTVEFGTFDWQHIYNSDYLFDFKWEVVALDNQNLKINLHSDYSPTGSALLKSTSK